ncbi:MAG: response regulator, partial [Anaerohalosphaera sp.]|nr:response regulator [Anaerohalosphaera sp.]
NDILDYSKIEAGKLEITKTLVNLPELIKTIETLVRPGAEKKGLRLKCVHHRQLPQLIKTDPGRLRQCILNLISNAIKFTDSGYVCLELSIEDKNGEPYIRFDVEDTGPGIPSESQKEIFDSFKQVDNSTSRKYEGTGLGLAVTKQLTELLGGELSVKSVYGQGSVFSLVIPAGMEIGQDELLEDMKGNTQMNDHKEHSNQTKFSGRVLVAEDVLANQKLIRLLLEKIGFEVTLVNNGNEAVQQALSRHFDLIFMDIQMPSMNGYEAAKVIRENSIETPIIALTANAMSNDESLCIIAGCSDYLSKLIDRQKLLDKICQYISPEVRSENIENVEDRLDGPKKLCSQQTGENEYRNLTTGMETSEDIIDFEKLIARLGDEELIKEIVPIFLADCKERFEDTRKAVLSRDSKAIQFNAHAIKGAAGNIGAKLLSDIACKLESFGKEDDTESAASIYEALETEYYRVVSFLSQPDWIQKTNKKTIEV